MERHHKNPLFLVEKDRAYVWHPFTQMHTDTSPLCIEKGKGAFLYTVEGHKYIDAISSWWVNLHGHSHPYIVEKIHKQAYLLSHTLFAGCTHEPAVELAFRLLSLLPGKMGKIFYSDNGSTAVEVALKMALQYWHNKNLPKTKVVCFRHSYHGDTFGAMSAAGKNLFNRPFWSHLFDAHVIDPPLKGQEARSLTQLKALVQKNDVACFIFEPLVLGVGGMVFYEPRALLPLLSLCKEYNVLTIADEVLTGFGRLETLFAMEQVPEPVDFFCLSKGLTGGFLPLGATACSDAIFQAFLGESIPHAFLHGHSYTANPLACTSALASLDLLLQEKTYAQRKEISMSHTDFCQQGKNHPKLQRCESKGTILALEYQVDSSSYLHPIGKKMAQFCLERGILVRPLGNTVYILPPYCIEKADLHYIYETLLHMLAEVV